MAPGSSGRTPTRVVAHRPGLAGVLGAALVGARRPGPPHGGHTGPAHGAVVAEAGAVAGCALWGHPEDVLALGMAVLRLVKVLDGRDTAAGWLLGGALAMQLFSSCSSPCSSGSWAGDEGALSGPGGRPPGLPARGGAVPDFHDSVRMLLQQPTPPTPNHATPWVALSPQLRHATWRGARADRRSGRGAGGGCRGPARHRRRPGCTSCGWWRSYWAPGACSSRSWSRTTSCPWWRSRSLSAAGPGPCASRLGGHGRGRAHRHDLHPSRPVDLLVDDDGDHGRGMLALAWPGRHTIARRSRARPTWQRVPHPTTAPKDPRAPSEPRPNSDRTAPAIRRCAASADELHPQALAVPLRVLGKVERPRVIRRAVHRQAAASRRWAGVARARWTSMIRSPRACALRAMLVAPLPAARVLGEAHGRPR